VRATLDATSRATAPGGAAFAHLSDGATHYEIAGPADGARVVLVHGISSAAFIWNGTFEALAAAGLRVLRYDLYGRGHSDRPHAEYGAALFRRQLEELLAAVGFDGPFRLVGLSMGGAVSIDFADRHPDRVERLALIAPAGMPFTVPRLARVLSAPLLGDYALRWLGERIITKQLARTVHRPDRLPELLAAYEVQLRYKGFKRALLSTMRHMPLDALADTFVRVGAHPRKVLLVWGRRDRIIPFPTSDVVRAALPRARFVPVDDAGHLPHFERPEVVTPELVEFLR
jgi:pimeloyl-ACP methyl ester carboxylesterase